MAHDLQPFRVAFGDDGQIRVPSDEVRSVHQAAVHLARQSGLGQTRADCGGNLVNADRLVENALAAIWKRDYRHR